jgi:hypothetical protein
METRRHGDKKTWRHHRHRDTDTLKHGHGYIDTLKHGHGNMDIQKDIDT